MNLLNLVQVRRFSPSLRSVARVLLHVCVRSAGAVADAEAARRLPYILVLLNLVFSEHPGIVAIGRTSVSVCHGTIA